MSSVIRRRIHRLHDPQRSATKVGNNPDASSGSARPPSQGGDRTMIFEQVATGGCQSYLVGCPDTCAGALIDPEVSQVDRYLGAGRARRPAHPLRHRHAHPRRSLLGVAPARRAARRDDRDAPRQPGAGDLDARRRRRVDRPRQAAPAGAAHARPHRRLDVPGRRGPRLHRRHLAHRRHRPHRSAERRPGGALRQPVRPPARRSIRRSSSTRRTTTRDAAIRPSAPRSRATRACSSASAPPSCR